MVSFSGLLTSATWADYLLSYRSQRLSSILASHHLSSSASPSSAWQGCRLDSEIPRLHSDAPVVDILTWAHSTTTRQLHLTPLNQILLYRYRTYHHTMETNHHFFPPPNRHFSSGLSTMCALRINFLSLILFGHKFGRLTSQNLLVIFSQQGWYISNSGSYARFISRPQSGISR